MWKSAHANIMIFSLKPIRKAVLARTIGLPVVNWPKIQFVGNSDRLPQTVKTTRLNITIWMQ